VDRLHYLDGDALLGLDGEAATDGSHPSDLGMVRYADAYEPALRAMLRQH
jgi:lysophospholipase L1-like esterase